MIRLQAYHGLFCMDAGSGVHYSEFLLVSVGSPAAYINSFNERTEDDTKELVKIVKRYDSTIYITKATDAMKVTATSTSSWAISHVGSQLHTTPQRRVRHST